VELGQHKRTHAYRVIPPLNFGIYCHGWRADEELLLLEGIEACGMGNWKDVAEQVGSKTEEECRSHYWQVYLDWEGFPFPVL